MIQSMDSMHNIFFSTSMLHASSSSDFQHRSNFAAKLASSTGRSHRSDDRRMRIPCVIGLKKTHCIV